MHSLFVIFVAHAALRFPGDSAFAAIVMSGLLLLAMFIAKRFGGWTTLDGAWHWLKAEPKWLFLILSAPIIVAGLSLGAAVPPSYNHVAAHAIEAFFFAYAFIAAGRTFWNAGIASIASWFRS